MATPEEQLKNIQQIQQALEDGFRNLTLGIQNVAEEIGEATDNLITFNTISKDITRTIRSISKANEDLISNQVKLNKGQLESKKIQQQIDQIEAKRLVSQTRLNSLQNELNDALASGRITTAEVAAKQAIIANLTAEIARSSQEVTNEYEKQLKESEKIEGVMGNLGGIVKGLNKIPILGNLINSEKVLEKMQETAAKTKNTFAVMGTGILEVGKSITKGLVDPLTVATFLINSLLKANKQTVELGKELGKDSYAYRENLAAAARSSSNLNVTTSNLIEAYSQISQATGFAYEFTADQLETQVKLTKQVGLQADEAAQIQRLSVLTDKSSEKIYQSFVKGLVAARNQFKVGINFKATLAEAAKVSGQLAANLGYNPERIAKAVVATKAFGMTLDQVAKSGESLLNFETSIENELKAELITGKQINLERARAAALVGDQVALAEELAANIGSSAEFTTMNVIQQKSLAEAVGMTTDELAETLRRREEAIKQGKSLAQITEEEATAALERQTIQDKFNATILKLQDIIVNLAAGPLGDLVSGFASLLDNALVLYPIVGAIGGILVGKMVTGIFSFGKGLVAAIPKMASLLGLSSANAVASITAAEAVTLGLATVGIIAGIASAVSAMNSATSEAAANTQQVKDGIAPSSKGPFTITDAFGATAITATGDSLAVSPNVTNGGDSGLMTAINELRNAVNALANKPTPAMAIQVGAEKLGEVVGRQSETGTNQYKNAYRLA